MKRSNWFTQHGIIICLALGAVLLFGSITVAETLPRVINIEEMKNLAEELAGQRVIALAAVGEDKKASPSVTTQPSPKRVPQPTTRPSGSNSGDISSDGTFTGYYQDTDLRVVLRQLSMLFRTNIVASKDVSGRVTVTLYDVTFDEALDSVLKSSGLGYVKKGKFIYIHTLEELAAIAAALLKMEVRTFQLDYVTAADAQTLIKPAMSPEGSVAVTPIPMTGINASATEAGNNSHAASGVIVVNDLPKNLDRITAIIKEIDIRPQQVLIEATILSARLAENNNLGVNFNVLGNTDFFTQGTTDGLTNISGVSAGAPTAIPGADLSKTLSTVRTDFSPVTGGITFGFVTDSISVFLRALEQVTDVTVLANPKLLVVNKQKGEVIVGSKDGYVTTVVSDGVATQSIEFLESGTRLVVRPYIGRNGYIRMMIHPEDSTGGVQITDSFTIPSVTTTEVTSNVLVRDGRTIVIGGLFRESTTNSRSQVPVLGSIPYLGTLFGSTLDTTERREVMVLLTPHIVKQEEFEAVSENMKDDVERFRVGARKGMQWWAADRLARSHMKWAREHLKNGRLDRARWDLDMALVRRPNLTEAIEMRENLTDKAYWAEEARQSIINDAMERALMFEMGKDFRKVVTPAKPRDYILPPRNKALDKGPTTRPAGKDNKAKVPKKK